jgi:transposase
LQRGTTPLQAAGYYDKNKTRVEIRKCLKKAFPEKEYHQRSKSETVNSAIKRKYDSTVRARKNHTQRQEILLKILAYNLNLVEILKDSYRARFFNKSV